MFVVYKRAQQDAMYKDIDHELNFPQFMQWRDAIYSVIVDEKLVSLW